MALSGSLPQINLGVQGNHQIARILRHKDESVIKGYIRNGGKEVKLFTSALKAFQCNNPIVMAQRKQLEDFLRCKIIGILECGRTQLEVSEELGIAQSIISKLWQRFQDDDECLQSEDIIRMDWPAYSSDLNPIEHVWDMLGQRIAARPTCLP
ncbi:uncharacterized protein TNCV_2565301 [Trichonephila clavipes]|uniref:Tc1-like transposase DDE domain-containing protein n=1 Tax=Trichonephila clavipes TaxID=2585209 RepID=A0A8X6SAN9_TRICX|nr:uncharacterized protein TNCV_2565301 [Trichonephila clavipes]